VYQLSPGSRAEQAVQAAGGFTANADAQALNLAVQLADGAKITVPEIGESFNSIDNSIERSSGVSSILINLNTATIEELMTLPSIGQERAELIIQYRTDHGGFKSIEEIQEISGVGPATFEKLKDMITVAP
jgi:competence protein ComEA